jgi:hypothetical protein
MARERDNLLTTLAALLEFGHAEAARLIIAEAQQRSLGEPGVESLAWIDDDAFEDLRRKLAAEAFRRERVFRPHTGDRWCRRAERVVVGDTLCLAIDLGLAFTPDNVREWKVQTVVQDGEWLFFDLEGGGERLRRRPGDLLVVRKDSPPVPTLPDELLQEVVAAGLKLQQRKKD